MVEKINTDFDKTMQAIGEDYEVVNAFTRLDMQHKALVNDTTIAIVKKDAEVGISGLLQRLGDTGFRGESNAVFPHLRHRNNTLVEDNESKDALVLNTEEIHVIIYPNEAVAIKESEVAAVK